MSAGQRALWFEQCVNPASNAYNLGACIRFRQSLDRDRLDAALAVLVLRHPVLRARFDLVDDAPCWFVSEQRLSCTVLADCTLSQSQARERIAELVVRPYALAHEHPFRCAVVELEEGSLFAIACHHIVSDLHSLEILARELEIAYAFAGEVRLPGAPDANSYADFCAWQAHMLGTGNGINSANFWNGRLANAVACISPVNARSTENSAATTRSRIHFALAPQLARALTAAAHKSAATPYVAVLTTFQILLAHWDRATHVIVGTPFSGRNQARFRQSVGYFVNLVPMVFEFNAEECFDGAVARNGASVRSALRHGQYPFSAMVEHLESAVPLVRATLTFQNTVTGLPDYLTRLALGLPGGGLRLAGELGEMLPLPETQSQFPFGITIAATASGFEGSLEYDPAQVQHSDAESFLEDWRAFTALCAEQADIAVGALLGQIGARQRAPADNLAAAIDDCIIRHAQRPAICGHAGTMSYRELGARSVQLAARLHALGVGGGARVAVVGDGGADTVVAMLAVLRSGAAFVPIDIDTGAAQIELLVRSVRASAVINCTDTPMAWSDEIGIAQIAMQSEGLDAIAPTGRCRPLDPAWLMYTSGTTGMPKAAIVPHEAALAHGRAIAQRFGLQPEDRVLQFASLSFDEHAEEIFPTLLAGACLVCMPRIRFQDPERLLGEIRSAGVSVLHLPTSYWHLWMDEMSHQQLSVPAALRLVNVGGEQASLSRLRTWAELVPPRVRWFNSYGLTEAAVTSLIYQLPQEGAALQALSRVPVGRPIAGTCFSIDAADGEIGELLLGGAGVGLGYFDHSEPGHGFFTLAGEHADVRWLRTGDMARVNADGDVEIIGRRDRSFKLHGMRVALPELEAALASHPAVKECVASGVEEHGDKRIDLHVVIFDGHTMTESQLRDYLREVMPAAPAPARVHFHAAIARTAGRKPDYATLRASQPNLAATAQQPTEDGIVDRITAIFSRHLLKTAIAPSDNFFSLGGHSLLAMRIVASLRRELGVDLSISDFLSGPTIDEVARLCRHRGATPGVQERASTPDNTDRYALSHAQRRALSFAAAAAGQGRSVASIAVMIEGRIEPTRVGQAWQAVVARHRLLHAEISIDGNQETSASDAVLQLAYIDLALPAALPRHRFASAARAWFIRQAASNASVRASLLSGGDGQHVLFIEARHAAVDGGCVSLLLREFAQACTAGMPISLTPATGYCQYVAAEAGWLDSAASATAVAFWDGYLEGAGHPTRLPEMGADRSDEFSSRRLGFTLSARVRDQVLTLARDRQCTPFAVLLAVFVALLHRYTLSDDIFIGVPLSLRDALGIDDAVGPTLNALPFRASVASGDAFSSLLQRTQHALSASLEHAVLPFEQIAARCPSLRDTRAPIPIQVVAQDEVFYRSKDGLLAFSELPERDGQSPVALLLGIRIGSAIRLECEYQSSVLSDAAAARIVKAMRLLLQEVVQCPDRPISEARMLSHGLVSRALEQRPLALPAGFPALLHAGLSEGASRHPARTAVICGAQSWTYHQLDMLANRHAQRLVAAGLEAGGHVIVASQKGIADVVAVLAILKAGGVYIPIAFDLPTARAAAMAVRTKARLVTGMANLETVFGRADRFNFIALDLHDCTPVQASALALAAEASAYILFTSGSTGEPKGVEVSHQAALATIGEVLRRFDIGENDVFYGFSALDFDLSVFDIFGALAAGACLVLPPAEAGRDPFVWLGQIVRHGVTIWNSVPGALDMLLEACDAAGLPSLRRLLVSGDWVGLDFPVRASRVCPDAMFVALGGATEAGIWSNCHVVDGVDPTWRSIPYGRALAGQSMFVAEPGGWPAPVGVVGEICIGGAALANGYWGDPALTREKFVVHAQTGKRVFRTGDLGRYFANGEIEFIGRRDQQIKLRGYRIEIGDIEAAIAAYAGVRRPLVSVMLDGAGLPDTIVAHVQVQEGARLNVADLRRHVDSRLPKYMRPVHYCLLNQFPLTANGKIDRASLPVPALQASSVADVDLSVRSDTERLLARLWMELIGVCAPGRDQNFFLLGGNSLQAVKLVTSVRREFGRSASLSQWLSNPTIAHMASLLDQSDPTPVSDGSQAGRLASGLRGKVRLDDDLVFAPVKIHGAGAVFITGASGLIGSRVIARYLSQSADELVCLVRDLDDTQAEGRLARFLRDRGFPDVAWRRRVRFVCGDLTQRQFGLSDASFAALATEIGSVFHVGANVNLVAGYDALEAANVGGTHEAIRLAALAGASMHYVSSVGVLPYGAGKTVTETDSIDLPGSLLTAYCQTKWVAEQTVRLAGTRGLTITVYRPGLTLDDTAVREQDMLSLLLSLTRCVGALPDLETPVDIVTADYVAAAMVHIARDRRAQGATFHLTHPEPVQFSELVKLVGISMPRLPFAHWRARLEAALPTIEDPRVAALGAMIAAQKEADITPARIDCSGTILLLRGADICCLPVAAILSRTLISHQNFAVSAS